MIEIWKDRKNTALEKKMIKITLHLTKENETKVKLENVMNVRSCLFYHKRYSYYIIYLNFENVCPKLRGCTLVHQT